MLKVKSMQAQDSARDVNILMESVQLIKLVFHA